MEASVEEMYREIIERYALTHTAQLRDRSKHSMPCLPELKVPPRMIAVAAHAAAASCTSCVSLRGLCGADVLPIARLSWKNADVGCSSRCASH